MINLNIRIPATKKKMKEVEKLLCPIEGTISLKKLLKILNVGKRVIVQDSLSHYISDSPLKKGKIQSVNGQLLISKILLSLQKK